MLDNVKNSVKVEMLDTIKTGDRVEITIKTDSRVKKTYVSQVETALKENVFLLHVPISYGRIARLPISNKYSLLFFTERGMVRFDAAILKYMKEDHFNMMTVKLLSAGERVQRRQFFRYSILQPLKFSVVDETKQNPDDPEDPDFKEKLFDGMTKDLGGGGVRFVSNESVDEESKLKCIITLGDEYLITLGQILHKQVFPKSAYKYQYRVMFLGMLPSEQEKIVHFIFAEQRKKLRRKD